MGPRSDPGSFLQPDNSLDADGRSRGYRHRPEYLLEGHEGRPVLIGRHETLWMHEKTPRKFGPELFSPTFGELFIDRLPDSINAVLVACARVFTSPEDAACGPFRRLCRRRGGSGNGTLS